METGQVEANLRILNETARLSYIDDLIQRKLAGPEKGNLPETDMEFHEREYERLITELESVSEKSALPETPRGKAALNNLLIRLRLHRSD